MGLLACLKGMLDHIAGHSSLYHPAGIHGFDVRKTALKLNLWVALKSHTVGSKIEAGLTTSSYTVLAGLHPGAPPQFPMHVQVKHIWQHSLCRNQEPQPRRSKTITAPFQLRDQQILVQCYLSLYHTRRENLRYPKNIFENLLGRSGLL